MTTISSIPDADTTGVAEFDAGEISGMRTAGWILLGTAGLNFVSWAFQHNGFPPFGNLVDVFLGIQLLHFRHSWRAWVLVRAGLGGAFALVLTRAALLGASASVGTSMIWFGQLVYCGSLFLLLFGSPSTRRVLVGRLVFGLAILITVAGGVVVALARAQAPVKPIDSRRMPIVRVTLRR